MPEGHTLHRLAGALHHAFAGQRVLATSPQGRFEDGAAQLNGRVIERAEAYGKHLFVHADGDRVLNVHLGLIGSFDVLAHVGAPPDPSARSACAWSARRCMPICAAQPLCR